MGCVKLDILKRELALGNRGNFLPEALEKKEHNAKKREDYYAGGSPMPGRTFGISNYRYGMNGMESDKEITGSFGNHYTAEYWMFDSRLIRRWNIDPVVKEWESPYACFAGNPIFMIDPSGANATQVITSDGEVIYDDHSNDGTIYYATANGIEDIINPLQEAFDNNTSTKTDIDKQLKSLSEIGGIDQIYDKGKLVADEFTMSHFMNTSWNYLNKWDEVYKFDYNENFTSDKLWKYPFLFDDPYSKNGRFSGATSTDIDLVFGVGVWGWDPENNQIYSKANKGMLLEFVYNSNTEFQVYNWFDVLNILVEERSHFFDAMNINTMEFSSYPDAKKYIYGDFEDLGKATKAKHWTNEGTSKRYKNQLNASLRH